MTKIVFGKVVLVTSLTVDRPLCKWLRVNIRFAKADAKAAEEAKKAEAESVVKKLLASGMSADEILEKLK